MVATTVSSQILKTMAKAEGFKYDVCRKFKISVEIISLWTVLRAIDISQDGGCKNKTYYQILCYYIIMRSLFFHEIKQKAREDHPGCVIFVA